MYPANLRQTVTESAAVHTIFPDTSVETPEGTTVENPDPDRDQPVDGDAPVDPDKDVEVTEDTTVENPDPDRDQPVGSD